MTGSAEAFKTPKTKVVEELIIKNKLGLHLRPVKQFVIAASKYTSDVFVKHQDINASGKSIISMMTLVAACGAKLKVTIVGEDAEAAMKEIRDLVENKFYEE
ncbi:MAG: HPr family phosphocarrier protein [Lentisphaerae bacterium]|nr:HPr family phosphocarrier protein [Lentisphaerota bacterium]